MTPRVEGPDRATPAGARRGPRRRGAVPGQAAQASRGAAQEERPPIRVIVADDSYLIREFLITTLTAAREVEVLAVCTNGKELEAAIETWDPEVVITDIRMPPSGTDEGIRIAARLHETRPDVGVVVLSQYAEPTYALDLLGEGTGGRAYLLKEHVRKREDLIGAIESVA